MQRHDATGFPKRFNAFSMKLGFNSIATRCEDTEPEMSSGMLFREVAAGCADGEFGTPRTNHKGPIGRK
jgi:hypothetical protein